MGKVGSKANNGWGRSLKHAARYALRDYYRAQNQTTLTYQRRFEDFNKWAKNQHLGNDLTKIDQDKLREYCQDVAYRLHNNEIEVSTAHNLISTLNTVYRAVTHRDPKLSPIKELGVNRSGVRSHPPSGRNIERVQSAADKMQKADPRAATVTELARNFGLRFREAALLDPREALKEAYPNGRVNISEGTKGNRGEYVSRYVPITSQSQVDTLQKAAQVQGTNRNLIPSNQTVRQFYDSCRTDLKTQQTEITKFHDLRASYACSRYLELTGYPAAIERKTVENAPDKNLDKSARKQISHELGHSRIEITNSYLGKQR